MFVYALASHKGGVGKTIAAATLGAAFRRLGRRVLLVDLDPQAALSYAVGAVPCAPNAAGVLAGGDAAEAIVPCAAGMEILPATAELAVALAAIAHRDASVLRMAAAIEPLAGRYDVALIDSPSALGIGMGCALAAADVALIPTHCDFLSLRGLMDMRAICAAVRGSVNPGLELAVFANMCDHRTASGIDGLSEARSALGVAMLDSAAPRSVRLAQGPAMQRTVFDFAPKSPGAVAYARMARELMERETHYGTSERYSGCDSLAAFRPGVGAGAGVEAGARALSAA
ncbi:MAG TPA: ParA family protein [Chthonomonadaceae bacterium]|nr:ParA family protein [Chthonomonadaceae bacterium]